MMITFVSRQKKRERKGSSGGEERGVSDEWCSTLIPFSAVAGTAIRHQQRHRLPSGHVQSSEVLISPHVGTVVLKHLPDLVCLRSFCKDCLVIKKTSQWGSLFDNILGGPCHFLVSCDAVSRLHFWCLELRAPMSTTTGSHLSTTKDSSILVDW